MPEQELGTAAQAWVVRTNALRRTFVSVKGFYFQAEVVGQPVTWLVPHALSQVRLSCIPADWSAQSTHDFHVRCDVWLRLCASQVS